MRIGMGGGGFVARRRDNTADLDFDSVQRQRRDPAPAQGSSTAAGSSGTAIRSCPFTTARAGCERAPRAGPRGQKERASSCVRFLWRNAACSREIWATRRRSATCSRSSLRSGLRRDLRASAVLCCARTRDIGRAAGGRGSRVRQRAGRHGLGAAREAAQDDARRRASGASSSPSFPTARPAEAAHRVLQFRRSPTRPSDHRRPHGRRIVLRDPMMGPGRYRCPMSPSRSWTTRVTQAKRWRWASARRSR